MLFDELTREYQMNIVIGDLDVTVQPGEDVDLGTDRDGSVAFTGGLWEIDLAIEVGSW